jgi:hypothetical protein
MLQEKPLSYPVKDTIRSSYTGKQFNSNPPKQGLYGAKVSPVPVCTPIQSILKCPQNAIVVGRATGSVAPSSET